MDIREISISHIFLLLFGYWKKKLGVLNKPLQLGSGGGEHAKNSLVRITESEDNKYFIQIKSSCGEKKEPNFLPIDMLFARFG